MWHENALLREAVEVVRAATCGDEYEAVWPLLSQVAQDCAAAFGMGTAMLAADDASVRGTGSDLLGVVAEVQEDVRGPIAAALLKLGEAESDGDVQWSIALALGRTQQSAAVPLLVRLAGHSDSDVRFQVANALPSVWSGDREGAEVLALIGLTCDADPEVRDWATFGLGTYIAAADTPQIRAALWDRTADDDEDAREEGICGLAYRRDPRAVDLMAGLLTSEDGVGPLFFYAAAVLGAAELLPLLEDFDSADSAVGAAIAECDPVARSRRDEFGWALVSALYRQRPDIDAALSACRSAAGLTLNVTLADGRALIWSVGGLAERASQDLRQAVSLLTSDLLDGTRAR